MVPGKSLEEEATAEMVLEVQVADPVAMKPARG
jgi:hypothetical protein